MLLHCSLILVIFTFRRIAGEIVETENGYVRGTIATSRNGREYLEFRGIPFAAPPVGELRLRPPQPARSWNGVRNSSTTPICIQPSSLMAIEPDVIGQEDCLYLNVFTPKPWNRGDKKLPVMVYIHGGGYVTGSANHCQAKYFMDRNVILIAANYRLGALGFLSLVDDVIPGNYGFKDQAFALRWVRRNVAAFGGDRDRVTIFGHSSGAASVHYHMMSPLSEGLFHGAIIMSGSAFSPWAFYDQNYTKALGTTFAYTSSCYYGNNTVQTLACLRQMESDQFVKLTSRLFLWKYDQRIQFRATIENVGDETAFEPFLRRRPTATEYVNDVPSIVGHSIGDGIAVAEILFQDNATGVEILNEHYEFLLPLLTYYQFISDKPEWYAKTGALIKERYFGDQEIGKDTVIEIIKLFTESLFSYPLMKTIQSKNSVTYRYVYEHVSENFSPSKARGNNLGVNHGDEMFYFFYAADEDRKMTADDRIISKKLIDCWVDFAEYGDPNGKSGDAVWRPVSKERNEFTSIKTATFETKDGYEDENYEFWDGLPTGL